MPSSADSDVTTGVVPRIAVLAMVVAALGLPVNDLVRYAVLLLGAVAIFSGAIRLDLGRWFGALAAIAAAVAVAVLWPAPRIDEGHNVFIVDGARGGALERVLPAEAYRLMAAEFEARYPRARRCTTSSTGCWRSEAPSRAYAFSADAVHDRAAFSRRVTGLDFSDPVWLRIGAINDGYNWTGGNELQRNKRSPRWDLLHPWRLDMPYFVAVRMPPDFAGSRLCWRGIVLWEGDDGRFERLPAPERHCRTIAAADTGRMILGVSIAGGLQMQLDRTWPVRLHGLVEQGLSLLAALAVILLLVRVQPRSMALPGTLVGLSLFVVFLHDASFIGGWRPFDGGDDGLAYEAMGRAILQKALAGEWLGALEGGEKVYFYGGPGLRYLRALERLIFGDTFFGYLSLMLLLPLVVFAAFRRFLGTQPAIALTLIFIAVPFGAIFGSTYFHYVKWAARGFADPAGATFFLAATVALAGRTADGPGRAFAPALGAGLLFALALWMRPNLAPGAAVLLGGAGLTALWQMQVGRLAGLCLGFLPVFGMALHNWTFGNVFVLFSSNITEPANFPTPPSVYVAALAELVRFDLGGGSVRRVVSQIIGLLAGPSEFRPLAPLGAVAVAILVRVALFGRVTDPWLRLIAGAALALLSVGLFYPASDRYHYLAWLLTLLVTVVWARDEGLALWRRVSPQSLDWIESYVANSPVAGLVARLILLRHKG